MTYEDAEAYMEKARSREKGRPLGGFANTRLMQRGVRYAVRLDDTDVVTLLPGGRYILSTGGWYTATTKNRINEFSPADVYSENGIWYLSHSTGLGKLAFEENLIIDSTGNPVGQPWVDAKVLRSSKRLVDKSVREYIDAFREQLKNGDTPNPGPGDCLYCQMESQRKAPPAPSEGLDHLLSHLAEKYLVPSLLVTAIKARRNIVGGAIPVWAATLEMNVVSAARTTTLTKDLLSFFTKRKLNLAYTVAASSTWKRALKTGKVE